MPKQYRPVRVLDDLLALVDGIRHRSSAGRHLWAKCKLRQRRNDPCVNCGRPVGTVAYRPLASPLVGTRYRSDRLCCHCVEDYASASVPSV